MRARMPSRTVRLLLLTSLLPLASCSSCEEPVPERRAAPPPPALAVTSYRLANGLEVELVSGRCGAEAAVAALFAVGADHDPPERSGMTHVIERALRASLDEHEQFESARDHSLYSSVVPSDELVGALERLARRLRTPEITADDITRAKREVLADLADARGGDATRTAIAFAAESVLPSRGDGWRGGVAAELEPLDRVEVQGFWRAHYAARNMRLVVAGPFDVEALRPRIEALFGSLPPGDAPTPREAEGATVSGTLVMGSAPTALCLAVRAPEVSEPLFPAFLVVAARLTSPAEGRTWQARYDPIREPGVLSVTSALAPGEPGSAAANALRESVRAEVMRPLTSTDRAQARQRFGPIGGVAMLDPETCASDPRARVVHRVRRAQLGLVGPQLGNALDAVSDEDLEQLAPRFERPTVVLGGGEIR